MGLATALVETIAALDLDETALERETAALRDRLAALERSATFDSTAGSKPPSRDGLNKKTTTLKHIRSQRGPFAKPSDGQPGHIGPTLTVTPNHIVDHDPTA